MSQKNYAGTTLHVKYLVYGKQAVWPGWSLPPTGRSRRGCQCIQDRAPERRDLPAAPPTVYTQQGSVTAWWTVLDREPSGRALRPNQDAAICQQGFSGVLLQYRSG